MVVMKFTEPSSDEVISKTIPNPGEVISSEHMLSEVNKLNKGWASQTRNLDEEEDT